MAIFKRPPASQPTKTVNVQHSSIHGLKVLYEPKSVRSLASNAAMILISAALLSWSFRFMKAQLTTVNSVDAVMNGMLTDIRAQQEGVISKVTVKTGQSIKSEDLLFVIENQRTSQLQAQEVSSRLNQQEAELRQAQERLAHKLSLLNIVNRDAVNQERLAVSENQQNQKQLLSDLEGTKSRYQLAQLNYKRAKLLKSEGAIAEASLDTAEIELKQRESEVKSLQAKLAALQVNQDAVRNGLSLSRTRSNYDPSIRLVELQLQIAEDQQGIETLKKMIQGTKAEFDQAKKDLQHKQIVTIKSPESGVMWRLTAQLGKFVQQGESLGQIAACNQRWVDAWVDEQKVQLLQVGTPAEIKLNGTASSITLTGKISVIRSGIGRLSAGEDTVVAMMPNLPRHTQVHITLDTEPSSSSSENMHNGNLCYIGYTGRVVFKVRSTSFFAGF
ncbi:MULTISPECIES: HlyD family secretion protein [Nostoc]|uniref:HlyD family efflux transporter periplasmic adaptor subunit n=2 Tax=Nostoc TaxID=1177 RepID=A0ABR8I9L3_9NOSO|nr:MULTISPECIES: HlyD family efflux transporter periplasmic adaptor subunit [Nostoc]MBD2562137.1 HlyD family efflux transporter periplasmic adaptor subunit [Nostoc linckia FACHB-391]MBD2647539.1 HlyD family efflux transporter periplasmic adaptor subunit [Nostoc foliaceum FACHB-393]